MPATAETIRHLNPDAGTSLEAFVDTFLGLLALAKVLPAGDVVDANCLYNTTTITREDFATEEQFREAFERRARAFVAINENLIGSLRLLQKAGLITPVGNAPLLFRTTPAGHAVCQLTGRSAPLLTICLLLAGCDRNFDPRQPWYNNHRLVLEQIPSKVTGGWRTLANLARE